LLEKIQRKVGATPVGWRRYTTDQPGMDERKGKRKTKRKAETKRKKRQDALSLVHTQRVKYGRR
jgi:hypothetical protein